MQQIDHILRARERQIQPPVVKQYLQPAGSKSQLSRPTVQTKLKLKTSHFPTHTYIAGNIKNCLAQWKALTPDPWIHQVVEGYQIEFSSVPPIGTSCPTYEIDKTQLEALDQEILDLLNKGAIEKVKSEELSFASPMLVVPKKGGKWRPIIIPQ